MHRLRFLPKRLAQAIPLLLGVLVLVFTIRIITPGDPATVLLGPRATPESIAAANAQFGLDQPLPNQFFAYVRNVVSGEFGFSLRSQQPVAELLGERLTVTAWLITSGTVLTMLVTVPASLWAASRRGRVADHGIRIVSLVGLGLPAFWVGVQLIQWVAIPTGWFRIVGFQDSFDARIRSIILPAITLAVSQAPLLIRSMRSSLGDVLSSDYVRTSRALGVAQRPFIVGYLLRNASIPTIALLASNVGFLLFGAVVVESTFSLPGLGSGMVQAVQQRDFLVVQTTTLLFAVIVLGVNLLADVVIALLDPRVEISS